MIVCRAEEDVRPEGRLGTRTRVSEPEHTSQVLGMGTFGRPLDVSQRSAPASKLRCPSAAPIFGPVLRHSDMRSVLVDLLHNHPCNRPQRSHVNSLEDDQKPRRDLRPPQTAACRYFDDGGSDWATPAVSRICRGRMQDRYRSSGPLGTPVWSAGSRDPWLMAGAASAVVEGVAPLRRRCPARAVFALFRGVEVAWIGPSTECFSVDDTGFFDSNLALGDSEWGRWAYSCSRRSRIEVIRFRVAAGIESLAGLDVC